MVPHSRPARSGCAHFVCVACLTVLISCVYALDNGVARTPPMGWNGYNSGFCGMREDQWRSIAYAMSVNGMKEAGYIYCNTDCGINGANQRDADGNYTWSTGMFPSGMPAVWDYVHSLELKAGLYIFPPHQDHQVAGNIEKDAPVFASWGCDYLKYDGWSGTESWEFPVMRDALLATGRPIVYSVNGASGGAMCNMWRTSGDIDKTWESVIGCLNTAAGGNGSPGAWPDPDMLQVGNLNNDIEEMTAFSLWCIISAPLIAGNDIRSMFHSTQHILLNTEAIAVNQDTAFSVNPSYGGSGKKIKSSGTIDLWSKTITGGAKAVLLVNMGTSAAAGTVDWSDIGISGTAQVRDLWEHANLGSFSGSFTTDIPPHGCAFLKIVEGTAPIPEPTPTWYPKPADPMPITPLPTAGWTASGELPYPAATNIQDIIDGNLATKIIGFSPCEPPYWFAIDMGAPQTFNCIVISSPDFGDNIGPYIKPYSVYKSFMLWELFVSDDGSTWVGPVDSTWSGPHGYTLFAFEPQTARHIKIVNSTPESNADSRRIYGLCVQGIGEVYVANADDLPVKAGQNNMRAGPAVSIRHVAPRLHFSTSSALPLMRGHMPRYVYTIDGRKVPGDAVAARMKSHSGVYIIDKEIKRRQQIDLP